MESTLLGQILFIDDLRFSLDVTSNAFWLSWMYEPQNHLEWHYDGLNLYRGGTENFCHILRCNNWRFLFFSCTIMPDRIQMMLRLQINNKKGFFNDLKNIYYKLLPPPKKKLTPFVFEWYREVYNWDFTVIISINFFLS